MTFYVTKITFLFGHGHILCCYYDFSCDQDCFFLGGGGKIYFYVTKMTFYVANISFHVARCGFM